MTSVSSQPVVVLRSGEEAIAAAHALAADLAPGAAQRDRDGRVPVEALELLRHSGLLGITVPPEYGGAGVTYETVTEVLRILGAADPAIAQVPQNHFGFVGNVNDAGTPEQRKLFLTEALHGARFGNAMSERGTKDIAEYRTRLHAAGDGTYRLTGRKYYCTGALTADWIPVVALDDAGDIVVPFVRRETAGVRTIDDWSAMGQRATRSGTTEFEDVVVPELHVVRDPTLFDAPRTRGAFAQIMLAAIAVGIAENALEDAAEFVRTRTRPWFESGLDRAVDDPHLLGEFGRLAVQLHAAQALLSRAARAVDAAEHDRSPERAGEASVAVAEAKAFGGEVAVMIASDLFALAGTAAADDGHNLHRHWRNARTITLHDPARWKYHHVGNHVVNGAFPPPSAYV